MTNFRVKHPDLLSGGGARRVATLFVSLLMTTALTVGFIATSALGAHAAPADSVKLSFAKDPVLPSASGVYEVELEATPSFPERDPGWIDPSQVMVGVYKLKAGETFDATKKAGYTKLLEKEYTLTGGNTRFTLSDYVTAKNLPQAGETLVPYIQTYRYNSSYMPEEKELIVGTPYTFPGGAAPAPKVTSGVLTVKFVDENGHELSGGDFDVVALTGTGSKDTLNKMPLGSYNIRVTTAPEGYQPSGPTQFTVTLTQDQPTQTVTFTMKKDQPVDKGSIPYAMLTPVLAPDHPSVFVRIEDTQVHPVNGMKVEIVDPNGNSREIVDAKLNSSTETEYKILALPLSEFSSGLGKYIIRLSQPGYRTTDVPFTLAARTQTPSPNPSDNGYVYVSDGKMTVTTEPGATLTVQFLVDPRFEDGIISVDQSHISSDGNGKYVVDFSYLAEQLKDRKHVKVVAQAPGKAPSDIVTVRLLQQRESQGDTSQSGSSPAPGNDDPTEPSKKQPEASESGAESSHQAGSGTDQVTSPTHAQKDGKTSEKSHQPGTLARTGAQLPAQLAMTVISLFAAAGYVQAVRMRKRHSVR